MDLRKIARIWTGLLVLLVVASYAWPGFGIFFVASLVILIGVANGLISIRSKKLGLVTGASAAVLVLATTLGAGLEAWQVLLFTAIGALAGFAMAAMPVSLGDTASSRERDDDRSSNVKAGGGGDFGGGGADGKY